MYNRKINIFDIADEAGVSIATVSRALSDTPNLNSAKQRRVLEVVQKYNYKPSVAARGLNQGHSKLISIGLPEIAHPFYGELFSAAADEARANGYSLILSRIPDSTSEYQAFLDQLIERRPDGVILAGGMVEDDRERDRLTVLNHLRNYMPIVLIGDPLESFPCVSISGDMHESAVITVRHLHTLGHKRIAFLGGKSQKRGSTKREQGYHEEMTKLGLEENICVRLESGYSLEDGAIGIQKLLMEFGSGKRPTAVIAINDLVAMGILRQLNSMGISVPEDIAVVGCDNQFFTSYTNPPLTTIDLHISELGRRAMTHLLHWEKGQFFHHVTQTNLVVRESCGVKLGRRKSQ
jgi:LacI family transcriptional regulator